MKENWVYRRGDIYMANLNPFKGSEQGGTRPVLVLQNNTGNLFCPTLIVAPLTTQVNKKKDQPTHYLLSGVRGLPEDENDLRRQVDNIEFTHPEYDEYRYSLDEIGHNPYELTSYLTVTFL